jgi:hypothetical protein
MRLSGREQIGTGAKSFAETAKPLFIGSIPIAASTPNYSDLSVFNFNSVCKQQSRLRLSFYAEPMNSVRALSWIWC